MTFCSRKPWFFFLPYQYHIVPVWYRYFFAPQLLQLVLPVCVSVICRPTAQSFPTSTSLDQYRTGLMLCCKWCLFSRSSKLSILPSLGWLIAIHDHHVPSSPRTSCTGFFKMHVNYLKSKFVLCSKNSLFEFYLEKLCDSISNSLFCQIDLVVYWAFVES